MLHVTDVIGRRQGFFYLLMTKAEDKAAPRNQTEAKYKEKKMVYGTLCRN